MPDISALAILPLHEIGLILRWRTNQHVLEDKILSSTINYPDSW